MASAQKVISMVSEKVCSHCKLSKPLSAFGKLPKGTRYECNECRTAERKAKRAGMPDTRKTVILTENGRVCKKCNQPKSWDEFHVDVHGYNQKKATCASCCAEKASHAYYTKPEYRRNTLKSRPSMLKKLYGITYADVVHALDSQHGLCANRACGKEINLEDKVTTKNRAVIDHDHKTGKFRALLCSPCNLLLGYVECRENLVLGLLEYRNKHNNHLKG